jgi:hypothetical protein
LRLCRVVPLVSLPIKQFAGIPNHVIKAKNYGKDSGLDQNFDG